MRPSRLTTAILLAAVTGAGCGSTDEELARELQRERDKGLTIVTRAQIEAQPMDSPQRAVLLIWRALQFRDAKGVVALFQSPPRREFRSRLEEVVVGGGATIAATSAPTVMEVDRSARRAVVIVELVNTRRISNEITKEVTGRLRLRFVLSGSVWKLHWQTALPQFSDAVA